MLPGEFIENGLFLPTDINCVFDWMTVQVDFAEVMEDTHQIGRTAVLPFQFQSLGQADQVFCYGQRVVKQAALIVTVVLGRSGSGEKAIDSEIVQNPNRSQRGSVRQTHEV